MPDIASALKAEISRIARKELKQEIAALKKASAGYRSDIAALKKQIQAQARELKALSRSASRAAPVEKAVEPEKLRFSAKRLASQRQKLGLSAAAFGSLLGVTGQAIYNWEAGKSRPSTENLAAIAALRGIGKRELEKRLAAQDQAEAA